MGMEIVVVFFVSGIPDKDFQYAHRFIIKCVMVWLSHSRSSFGKASTTNAALFAIAILANSRRELRKKLRQFRQQQEAKVRAAKLD